MHVFLCLMPCIVVFIVPISDVHKAISIKAKARAKALIPKAKAKAKAECLQEQDKPHPV